MSFAERISICLPPLLSRIGREGSKVVRRCEPMDGSTCQSSFGKRRRHGSEISSEIPSPLRDYLRMGIDASKKGLSV
ncbi:3-deoxy-7-phosphoheptulonate synthase [Syntrophus sp. (in: bacteria)]|uniref:3-deoxy-7-phosphoheptulonate synthase n=1 Tax=Syntrophus sp. (in: bacteria) TaxID=48412 RepID=UPI00345EA560